MTAAAQEIHAAAMEVLHRMHNGDLDYGASRMRQLEQQHGFGAIPTMWMHWATVIAKDRIHKGIPVGDALVPQLSPRHCYEIAARVVDACRGERPDAKLIGDLAEQARDQQDVLGVSAALAVVACMIVYRN